MTTLFVAFDGDSIGAQHGRALLSDDPAEVRHVSSAIEAGEEIWRSWALKNAGSLISAGGDEGMVEVSPEVIAELPDIRKQYASTVGATCTVGVGRKMSEAAKALLVGKHRGKDRICVYSDSMKPELDEIQNATQTEDQKLNVYLAKDDGSGGGVADHGRGVERPHHQHSDAVPEQADVTAAPPPGPGPQDFHALAQRQDQSDRAQQAKQSVDIDALRQQTAEALMAVKAQLPVIQQVAASYPETAKAVLGLTQAVTNLARGVSDAEQTFEKSEIPRVQRIRNAVAIRMGKPVLQQEPDPSKPPPADGELDKTVDGLPHHKAHRALELPIGAQAGGEIKVKHDTGKAGWRSVRAGLIMGTDPVAGQTGQSSHPVSSRRPGST